MKRYLSPILTMASMAAMAAASIQSSQASSVINFTTLSSGDGIGSNSLQANGSSANLTVTRTEDAVAADYLYEINYTGVDFNGDMSNDTLNLTVRVDARRNGTITYGAGDTSSATIGGNGTSLPSFSSGANNLGAWVSQTDVMVTNASLIFTIENISVSTGQSVESSSFTGLFMDESRGSGHQTVIGSGSNLPGYAYNSDQLISLSSGVSTLYVSNGLGANDAVGVGYVDFSVTVSSAVPEPSSATLIGIGGIALFLRRRR